MRLVNLSGCIPGLKLAQPIYDNRGRMLLGRHVELTAALIDRLHQLQIAHVYVEDEVTKDITLLDESISIEARTEAVQTIKHVFTDIQNGKHKSHSLTQGKMVQEFKNIFNQILSEMRGRSSLLNLLSHIQVKDNYVFTHSLNVSLYTLTIAIKMRYSEKRLYEIGLGALLHDIGKMLIPPEVLHKPGKLTDEEFELIKKHPEYGYEILKQQHDLSLLISNCAFQHHEKLDGSGYPRGVKAEDIHHYAKVIAVADVFDALTTHRSYRDAMLPHEAMEIIFAGCHTHFDAEVVEAFRRSVALYPIGVTVHLSTGETAVVVGYDEHSPMRPRVRIFQDAEGKPLEDWIEIDLNEHLSTMIVKCDAIL